MRKKLKSICILGIILAINLILLLLKKELNFNVEELPSSIVNTKEKKAVDGDESGYLTYGPYVSLKQGDYKIVVNYNTDSDLNTVEIFSLAENKYYYKDNLSSTKNKKTISFSLDKDINDLEIRIFFAGSGELSVDKMILTKNHIYIKLLLNIILFCFLLNSFGNEDFLKNKFVKKKVVFAIFMATLFIPLSLGLCQKLFHRTIDFGLKGNFNTYTKPTLSLNSILSGVYQKDFEAYWNNSFVPRGSIIKAYNQLRYTLFNEGNRIVGRNKSIFEIAYIEEYFGLEKKYDFSLIENQQQMDDYIDSLIDLSNKLELCGKKLIIYTTPSKVDYEYNNLPYKYKIQDTLDIRAIDYFIDKIKPTSLVYLNSTEFLNEEQSSYPIFYNTGIHWSRPAEQEISHEIINIINNELNIPTKKFNLTYLKSNNEGYWRDLDVYDLLNIYNGKIDSEYYEYKTEGTIPDDYQNVSILLQGGSFGQGFRKDFLENSIGDEFINIFYDEYIIDSNDNYIPIKNWVDLDIKAYLDKVDVVIIEVNEQALANYSNGFVSFLNLYMDTYLEMYDNENGLIAENLDISNYEGRSNVQLSGFYEFEDDIVWTKKYCTIKLENERIKNKGLQIVLNIPDFISYSQIEDEKIKIFVNGSNVFAIDIKEPGRKVIKINSDQLQVMNDEYFIEIYSPFSFIPKDLGINSDERELSIQIYYVGEVIE